MSRQLFKIPHLERDVAIYLAGLIDGEGCFFISKQKKHEASLGYAYSPEFKLVLTDESTIKWVADKLERGYIHTKGNISKNQRDSYDLRITDHEGLVAFIPQILPFMKIKKEAAQTMLEFCLSRRESRKESYNAGYKSTELSLFTQLRVLNRVGIIEGRQIL